jgi:hypothetical protein
MAQVLVPDLTGLSKAVANGNLAACNLTLTDGTGTNTFAIASQSVAAGSLVATGGSVTVNYGTLAAVSQGKGVCPVVLATTPTGQYNLWRLASMVISTTGPLSDKFTLGTPYSIISTFIKGTFSADGYWQDSPTDAPVIYTIPDLLKLAVSDTTIANILELVAGYIANGAKTAGLL